MGQIYAGGASNTKQPGEQERNHINLQRNLRIIQAHRKAGGEPRVYLAPTHDEGAMNIYEQISDEDAAVAAANGDDEAFSHLFQKYHTQVVRQSCRWLGNDYDAAEEVAQITWVQAHRKIASFNPKIRPFTAWLHSIRIRRCLNYIRNRKRRPLIFSEIGGCPQSVLARKPIARPHLPIEKLPDKLATAIRVVYLEDRSFPEAAKILGCAPGTVHRRTLIGLKLLRKMFGITNADAVRRPQVRPADTRREIQMLVA